MTTSRPVAIKKMPESVVIGQIEPILNELTLLMDVDRPCLVLDLSEVRQLDSAGIEMLLHCMEEAMKCNGDIKLAAVSPQATVILELTRVNRLFEIFENPSDAVESYRRFPVEAFRQDGDARPKAYGTIG